MTLLTDSDAHQLIKKPKYHQGKYRYTYPHAGEIEIPLISADEKEGICFRYLERKDCVKN